MNKLRITTKINKNAIKIIRELENHNYQAYLVGGCVRDLVLDNIPKDWDITTSATPNEIINVFKNKESVKIVEVGKSFGVMIVIINGESFEVATFRADGEYKDGRRPESVVYVDNAKEDVKRRDFTINGLLGKIINNSEIEIIDYVGGLDDLKNKKIKFISDVKKRINEDRLRVLRYVRFANRFDFGYEEKEFYYIKNLYSPLSKLSRERVIDEFLKMLKQSRSIKNLILDLIELNLLQLLFLDLYTTKDVWQNSEHHPEINLLTHLINTAEYIKQRINDSYNNSLLIFAGLFHDIGKIKNSYNYQKRKIDFSHHTSYGIFLIESIMKNYKMSNRDIEYVKFLIQNHDLYINAENLRLSRLKRLKTSEYLKDLLLLMEADIMSSDKDLSNLNILKQRLNEIVEEKLPEPLITGYDLIDLGYKPSSKFKETLDYIRDLQLNEVVLSKEKALKCAKDFIKTRSKKEIK